MRTAALLLLLGLLPAAASAQGLYSPDGQGRPDQNRSYLTARTGYSDSDGLAHRSLGASGSAALGRGLTLETGATHHRILKDGWLPGELYSAGFRVQARSRKNSFSAGLQSNSDRPFYSIHETNVSVNAARTFSSSGPHSFSAGLMYSSRRSFARHIPFPYVSYSYRSEKFSFRLPFFASWRPSRAYELSAAYIPPKYCQASVLVKASETLSFKAEYIYSALQFEQAGRPDKDYSTYIEQANAGLWTQYKASSNYNFSLWTGWALRGRYFRGKAYDDHHDRRRIGSSPALALSAARLF